MAHFWRDFWIRETGTGQQVAQLHDRYMMMMMMMTLQALQTPHPMTKCHHSPADLNLQQTAVRTWQLDSIWRVFNIWSICEPQLNPHHQVIWCSVQQPNVRPNCSVVLPNQSSALIFNKKVKTCHCHLKTRGVQYIDTSCLLSPEDKRCAVHWHILFTVTYTCDSG